MARNPDGGGEPRKEPKLAIRSDSICCQEINTVKDRTNAHS